MTCVALLKREDLRGAAEIEKLCFAEPWSEKSLELLLTDGNFGVAAVVDNKVVAYGGMTCVLDEGAVTNIAVHPDHRRQGLGRAVLSEMLKEAEKRGISCVFLEVRVSNSAARQLYSSAGFTECGIRKNFYKHPTEDALQMVYTKN